jgi:tetratricopeptide (TPR) repeat protein
VLHNHDWDFASAEREVKRAIELKPNDSEAHWVYALHLSELGLHDEAIREIKLAEQLDPLSTLLKGAVGDMYFYSRQYDRAIEESRRVIALEPNLSNLHLNLGRAYVQKGMYDEGIAEIRKGVELSGGNASRVALLAWALARTGNRSEATKVLDESLRRLANGEEVSKVRIAATFGALGDRDQAFAWLEKAYQERSPVLVIVKVDPILDSLRSDPRFADLLRRVGLPQ